MKKSTLKTLKILLTTCFASLVLCAGTLLARPTTLQANAEAVVSSEYTTDGASVRVFKSQKKQDGNGRELVKATKQGIRFHVQTVDGYTIPGTTTPLLDTTKTNENNGSFVLAEGYKTYTLVIPTKVLNNLGGELSFDTATVLQIETTGFWFYDTETTPNWESVAYVYNVPEKWYTENFSYRGVIVRTSDNEVVAQTDVAERSLAYVAKKAYQDTIKDDVYWGSAELDDQAAPMIKAFVPTYTIAYTDAQGNALTDSEGNAITEEVLWGEKPTNVPTDVDGNAWYDTEGSEEIDVTQAMNFTTNRTLTLATTSSEEFVLTGVAAEADFEVKDENDVNQSYHGVKVFATLHTEAFADKTQMDIGAVNIEHKRGDEVLCDGIELQGVWTLKEQNSIGEWQMRLFFALDTSDLQNGDKIVIKGDSVFYANGVMYKLTEDYTIDYTKTAETEDYGMFLGYLYNSDVKEITNCAEDSSGNQGEPDEFTVRIEFYDDVMINGEFTFEFGSDSDTTKYPYPVYIQCGQDATKLIPISGGRYYWNEGNHKILELIGTGEYTNKVFGWHSSDKLYGAPGTIVKQNGGYYIFQDEMYAYFLADGNVDAYGYATGAWVVGTEKAQYATSEFATQGTVTAISDYGTPENEIRITTTNHWFPESAKVSLLTTENMSKDDPYAVYRTSKDGTVTEIEKVRYHGQENPDGGYYQILGFCDENDFAVGDVVTIAAGARFWLGTEYYTVTEEITYYYTGSFWAQNYDESTMGELSSASFGERAHNQGDGELRMYFTAPLDGYTTENEGAFNDLQIGTGSITLNGTPFTYVRYQRWDAGATWLAFGGTGMIGKAAFGDKVVIEAGTTIWSANNVAYTFTEKVEWIYAGPNSAAADITWSRVLGGVTVSSKTTNANVSGVGTFAVGNTYTLTATPDDGYLISSVIVNNTELPLTANNTYTFTVAQSNTIKVTAEQGKTITFVVPEGAKVDGGEISNNGIKVVANGGSLTFSVAATEGYKITGVANVTNNNDGTYTVSNVTADTTVTVTVDKLYKVTYSGENASITTDNVANGAYVDNGTTVTFTVSADSGCTLVGVANATKVNATTYTATVNGADLTVTATALENSAFTDITDRIAMEDRSWGAHTDEVYVGLLDTGITNTVTNEDGTTSTNHYFNTSVNDTWYVGNDAPITNNDGVDIMEYIYVNGQSARSLITENANGDRLGNSCSCWLSNPAAYPVYVETTNGSGLMMRLATAAFDTNFTVTIKAGFRITNADGDLVAVTKDVEFVYNNSTINKEVITSQYTVTLNGDTAGATVTANGNTVSNGAKFNEGTEITITPSEAYNVSAVTVNGETLTANNGVYTFTLLKDTTINISATIKTYTVTASCSGGVKIDDATSKTETVQHGSSVTFTLTVPANATIKANDTVINGTSYTVSNVTANTTITFTTWYTVTVTTGNSSVSGVTSGSLYESGSTPSVTVTPSSNYAMTSIQINGGDNLGSSTYMTAAETISITISGPISLVVTTEAYPTISITPNNATVTLNGTDYTSTDSVQLPKGSYTVKIADRTSGFTTYTVSNVSITGSVSGTTSGSAAGDYPITVSGNVTITVTTEEGGCLVEGTMVTLADGTQKAVEDLKMGDELLVFNHETGKYDVAPLLVNTHATAEAAYYTVISLSFSNGQVLRIADEHAVFSKTENKYVYINADNAYEFIGDEFISSVYENGEVVSKIVTLDNVTIAEEYVRIFTPVSAWHMNVIADNMLTLSGRTVNFFEYDETMKYDEEKMQADIEQYGLYTYEDFADYVSEEVFNAFPFKYFKVAIEKGDYTWDELMFLLSEYNQSDSEK